MLTQKLYLVRHGETRLNACRLMQGSSDEPLNESGERQAAALREYFLQQSISFDHAYCSPLRRAIGTLNILTDLPHAELHDLREREYGSCEMMPVSSVPPVPYRDYFSAFGGESDEQVFRRMDSAMREILAQPGSRSILVISHGAALRNLLAGWSGIEEAPHTILPNCGAALCIFTDGRLAGISRLYPPQG